MTTTCIIQARTGSTRLPGKVLQPVRGVPLLGFMLDRLADLAVDTVVVATSDLDRDDAVAEIATQADVPVVRGDEADVLRRFVTALDAFPADTVIRLTADCPLIDPRLVEAVVATHRAAAADYTSNALPRTFPKGLDVEVMTAVALRAADAEAGAADEREHVTPFIYRRPERFRCAVHLNDAPLGREWWTVDTPDDLAFVQGVADHMPDPHLPWRQILEFVGVRAGPRPEDVVVRPARADDLALLGVWLEAPDLAEVRTSAGHRLYVGERGGVGVGAARVDIAAGVGTLRWYMTPDAQEAGLEPDLLAAVGDDLRLDVQTLELRVPDPAPQVRAALLAAGFVPTGDGGGLVLPRDSYGIPPSVGSA